VAAIVQLMNTANASCKTGSQ